MSETAQQLVLNVLKASASAPFSAPSTDSHRRKELGSIARGNPGVSALLQGQAEQAGLKLQPPAAAAHSIHSCRSCCR